MISALVQLSLICWISSVVKSWSRSGWSSARYFLHLSKADVKASGVLYDVERPFLTFSASSSMALSMN